MVAYSDSDDYNDELNLKVAYQRLQVFFTAHQTLAPTYQLREPEIVGKVGAGR
jgi:hypothetical protein